MKFELKPYKLFCTKDVLKYIKWNLTGSYTWKGYVRNNKPDHKFGHTRFEYVLQIPLLGVLITLVGSILLIPIIYTGIFIQQIKEK